MKHVKQFLAWILLLLARFSNYRGKLETTITLCYRGLDLALPRSRTGCELLLKSAFATYRSGRKAVFKADATRALAIAREEGYGDLEATALGMFGIYHQQKGEKDEALRCYFHASEIFRTLRDSGGEAKVLIPMGTLHRELGDYDNAENEFHRAVTCTRKRRLVVNAWLEQGRLAFVQGDMQIAERRVRSALKQAGWLPWLRFPNEIGDCHRQLARIAAKQGRKEEARAHFKEAHFLYRLYGYTDKADAILCEARELQTA